MKNDLIRYTACKEVQLFHTGATGLMTPSGISRFAQEMAGYHAAQLGFGFDDLQRLGIAWVLREQSMDVCRFPALGEKLTVTTWPTGAERILCHRDYTVSGTAGDILVRGTTAWFGLNIASRRPVKAASFFNLDGYELPGSVFETPAAGLERLESDQPPVAVRTAYRSDLDALGHMNNLRYMDWALDLGAELGLDAARSMQIRHVREVMAGEEVRLHHASRQDGSLLVDMRRSSDDQSVCLVRMQGR